MLNWTIVIQLRKKMIIILKETMKQTEDFI